MNYTASPADVFDIYCIDVDQTIGSTAYNARVLSFADAVNSSLSYNGIDNFTALKRVLGTVGGTGAIANTSAECLSRLAYTSAVTLQFGAVPTTAWDEIHIALWGAFSPSTTYAADGIGGSVAGSATLGAATSMASGYDYSNWRIILDESAWDAQAHGSYRQGVITEVTSVVPEPSTYALLGAGLLAVGFAARRRNRSTQQFSAGNSQLV
ncbi:MAG: PEP-CTERM sorting domain-containing protein [Phycisphaerae bacterium]|nr:PEP-CTERM sorting domain-containing protein [Gemmatimonadaceae bacterium]